MKNCVIFCILFFILSCSTSRYSVARSLYQKKNYASAIEYYDLYLQDAEDGGLATSALLERSDCYFQLGKKAEKKENWTLAIRFYYLANSKEADERLDNVYYKLSQIAESNGNIQKSSEYNQYILDNLPTSELIPMLLATEIERDIIIRNNVTSAWNRYKKLCLIALNSEYCKQSQILINPIIKDFINVAENNLSPKDAIEYLLEIQKYPSDYISIISEKVGKLYITLAEDAIKNEDYLLADEYFNLSIKYDYKNKPYVDSRLHQICNLFIDKGLKLVSERKIDEAIKNFEKTFEIIPDYKIAKEKIELANKRKKEITDAKSLFNKGLTLEKKKEFKTALDYYKKSYSLDKLPQTLEKIELMNNIIEIEKNPSLFAREVLFSYKNGIIKKKMDNFIEKQRENYKDNVKVSDWQFILSVGDYNYEARIDIITPEKSYFFVWLLNLKIRKITPMNKTTEEFLKWE